jgi:hypothetical protein
MPSPDPTAAPLLLGFLLGMRHAIDADHVIAMSTIVARERSLIRASLLGGYWGLGHSLSLLLVGVLVVFFRVPFAPSWSIALERAVGVMLVGLGVWSLVAAGRRASMAAALDPRGVVSARQGGRPFAVGMVHGLAGSGALSLFVVATIPSRSQGLLTMALFGAGSIGGMMLITTLVAFPATLGALHRPRAASWIPSFAALASVAFGMYYLWISA